MRKVYAVIEYDAMPYEEGSYTRAVFLNKAAAERLAEYWEEESYNNRELEYDWYRYAVHEVDLYDEE